MGMIALTNMLKACYPANTLNPTFLKTLNEYLPKLTPEQGKQLAGRLVSTYKFAPSIAEILREWKQIKQETNRHIYNAPKPMGKMSPAIAKMIAATQRRIENKEPVPLMPVSPEVLRFARQFFPEISETTVQRNYLEITNCRNDRAREIEENSKYRTLMIMDDNGIISLMMRKIV